mmetsp:Transcript_88019/g.247376  ORF Transcript_88019/g.247376 Transcript_88019/m.247376 type:complete len:262 (-) Transcript_88019:223-1008(-)
MHRGQRDHCSGLRRFHLGFGVLLLRQVSQAWAIPVQDGLGLRHACLEPLLVALHLHARGHRRSVYNLHGAIDVLAGQVRELDCGDFPQLFDRDGADDVDAGPPRTLVLADRFVEQRGRRRRLQLQRVAPVAHDVNDDGDDIADLARGERVVFLHKEGDVGAELTQSGAHGRRGCRLPRVQIELDSADFRERPTCDAGPDFPSAGRRASHKRCHGGRHRGTERRRATVRRPQSAVASGPDTVADERLLALRDKGGRRLGAPG